MWARAASSAGRLAWRSVMTATRSFTWDRTPSAGRRAVIGLVRRAKRVLELVDELARDCERLFVDRVVDPRAFAPRADEPGVSKRCQMLGDARLAVGELLLEVADAERAAGVDL